MAVRPAQPLPLFHNLNQSILRFLHSPKPSLSETRQAHAYIIKSGISDDTLLATKLLSFYGNHHSFTDATLLHDSLSDPNVFSFSSLIYSFTKHSRFAPAIRVFAQMLTRGIVPDTHLLPSVIKACGGLSSLRLGNQVHCAAYVSGLYADCLVQSSLVHMYIQFDRLKHARKLFDKMSQPGVFECSALLSRYARKGCIEETKELLDKAIELGVELNLVSWNGMITGFNHSGKHLEAVFMFQKMLSIGFSLDGISVSSVLPAIGELEMLQVGVQIHGCVVKQGLGQDECVVSALIGMYGKCTCAVEMSKVFDDTVEKDVGTCNALITGLSRNGLFDNALEVFKGLRGQRKDLNVVSWTSIIAGCSQNGKDIEALELFREMQIEGVEPNFVTIPCLLPACGNIAALMHGKATHCFSLKNGISNDVYVGSALIDMYAKCGRIQASRLCFDMMPKRNLVCWNALMSGYSMHGKFKEAKDFFQLMQKKGQKPDSVTFTCILSACSQSGLIDEGRYYFNSMYRDYGLEPRLEHYACMVTLLGRAGRLEEAYSMIKQMPFEPNGCVWGPLLSSCRVHNNVNLAEIAAKKLFELEPRNPGNYILLSNLYASKSMWVKVYMVRDMMKSIGLRKNPGCSWIELKNKVHMLHSGDTSHPQMAQITEKMVELSCEMKRLGYSPQTDMVLQDVEEQDKEQILCGHSEKLAVVLGIMNTSSRSPLQVIKNLRICEDCHSFMKFISSFEQREIFVRDTNRFHCFKDGVCSCGDYW